MQRSLKIIEQKDNTQAFKALLDGQGDAWITDDTLLYAFRAGAPDPKAWSVSDRRLTVEPLAIMFRKDDPAFAAVVNGELRRMMRSGEFDALYKAWFQSSIPEKNIHLDLPMSHLLRMFVNDPSDVLPASF